MARIIIVEDDINIAKGLEGIIKSIDSNIETTITGYAAEALEHAKTQVYDIFLIDIQLLDYSGFEFAKEIRNIDKYKLTPIVFITAVPTRELLAFKEIHCYDYIIKPFKKEKVLKTIGTLIDYGVKKHRESKHIEFNLKDYIYSIELDEIIYFESLGKKIKVVTTNEEIELSGYTLIKLLDILPNNFIRCHRGYIINKNYIYKIKKADNLIKLSHLNIFIPIGRKYKDCLRGGLNELY